MKNKIFKILGLVSMFLFINLFTSLANINVDIVKGDIIKTSAGPSQNEVGVYNAGIIVEIPNSIYIDNNWTETVAMYDWCTGTGTEEDPYIIQDIKIDMDNKSRYGIKISKGSNFVIRNCIFTNTTNQGEKTAGIYIIEAEQGLIEYNNFTYCKTGVFSVKAKMMSIFI